MEADQTGESFVSAKAATGGNDEVEPTVQPEMEVPKKKRKSPTVPWKKPKDMPKRPLSAYNLFFQSERRRLLEQSVKDGVDQAGDCGLGSNSVHVPQSHTTKERATNKTMSFSNLGKMVAAKWKALDVKERSGFEARAAVEKQIYNRAVTEWRAKNKKEKERSQEGFDLAVMNSTMPDDLLATETSGGSNPHIFKSSNGNRGRFGIPEHVAPSISRAAELGLAPARSADVVDAFQTSSSSVWASHNLSDVHDVIVSTDRAGDAWSATPTENSSKLDGLGQLQSSRDRRQLPNEYYDRRGIRHYMNSCPVDECHGVSAEPIRISRSASFPSDALLQTHHTLSQSVGFSRSQPTSQSAIAGYSDPIYRYGLSGRSASFSDALPPPTFRLHESYSHSGREDAGIRRCNSVGAQSQLRQGNISPFQAANHYQESVAEGYCRPSGYQAAWFRQDEGYEINNLRRILDNDMLDFLTGMSDYDGEPNSSRRNLDGNFS